MSATIKWPDTFGAMLAALQATYEAEIRRLADEYRPRILAGEFSGNEGYDEGTGRSGDDQGDRSHLRLERELQKKHPWMKTERGRLAIVACSRWLVDVEKARTNPKTGEKLCIGWDGDFADAIAAECMSHDVLAVAAERGWVKRMRYLGDPRPYALRVA